MHLDPAVVKSLALWREHLRSRRKHAAAIYSRCLRFLCWANVQHDTNLTSWRDVRPTLVDYYFAHRLETGTGHGAKPLKTGTIARDVGAVRMWLEWNEEQEMAGPIRSQYLRGRIPDKRDPDRFALTDDQVAHLMQRARWVKQGQTSLKFVDPNTGTLKSAWCAHWPEGAFHLFCRLGLELGLRPRELFWVAWDDIQPMGEGVILAVQDHGHGGRVINEVKKGAYSRRRMLVPPTLCAELEAFRQARQRDGTLRRFVFAIERPDKPGGWMPPEIAFIFKALKREMNEPRLVCNTLRKTCGQRLRRKGLDYFAVAQFLGHSATTCMRYYVQDCREDEAFDPLTCKPVKLRMLG